MEIHLLDILVYFLLLIAIHKILGDEYTTDLGGLVGLVVILIYTILYCIIFYFYDWVEIIKYITIKV